MRLASVVVGFVATLSFLAGSFLIFTSTATWIVNQGSFGLLEMLALLSLGGLLVFLTLPIALFGFKSLPKWFVDTSSLSSEMAQEDIDNQSLFSNKRIMGLSLVITGLDWLVFSLVGLWLSIRSIACPVNVPCGSILSYTGSWILIAIGVSILAIGIALIMISIFGSSANEIRTGEAPLKSIGPSLHSLNYKSTT
ncbi:MAG: hypothetical protein JRN52_03895 [Nitrososphaerota archaeon]|nr:hypothetical protein [Nitrososphaerota archaeon]